MFHRTALFPKGGSRIRGGGSLGWKYILSEMHCRCCVCSRGLGPGDEVPPSEADDLSADYTTVICAERKQNSVLSS